MDKSNRTNTAIEYLNIILSNCALPIFTIPTRVTSSSSTIIDHIITNDLKHNLTPFVIQEDTTDHFPIGCFVQNLSPKKQKKIKTISYYRDKSKFKSEDFCDDVQSKFFAYIINMPDLDCDNVNGSFNGFENLLRSIIDDHAPLKRLSRRQRKLQSKPWLTKGIHISICNRQTMFRPLFFLGNNSEKTFYRKYSN